MPNKTGQYKVQLVQFISNMLSGSVHFVAPSPTSPLLSPDYGVGTASGEGVEHPGSGDVEWAVVQGIAGQCVAGPKSALCNPATVQ